ncbi:hypothetical protein ABH935_009946 [Catenulispora sp. GAS73]|uniref:hypothetical protein n=1 Tax=Catenulispora sp. GAS73 TaxID=3156269 RepID=UPI0035190C0A
MRRAQSACWEASQANPADPVPHLGLLALACARRTFTEGPAACPIPGPWSEFFDVWRIDPGNREAAHRMLGAIAASGAGGRVLDAQMFARWIASFPEIGPASPVKVLPLYALVRLWEQNSHVASAGGLPHLLWTTDAALADIQPAWAWFRRAEPATRLVLDLSHLAHALWAAHRLDIAADVFEAIGAYGATRPWEQVADDGVAKLVQARAQSMLARHQIRTTTG